MIMEERRVLTECSVLGDLSLSWSIFIILSLGFLAGVASTSLFVYLRRRKQLSYEIEYREKCNEGKLPGDPRELILSSSSLHQCLSHPIPDTKLNIISPTTTKPPTLWAEKNEEINISTNPLRDSIAYCSTIMTLPLPSPMREQHISKDDGPFDLVIHDNPAASISPLSSSSSLKQQPIPLYNPDTNKVNNKHNKEEGSSPCGEADDAPLGSGRSTKALLAAALKQQHLSSSSSSQETEAAAAMAISIEVRKDASEAESLEHITSSMHYHHHHHDHGTDGGEMERKDTIVLIPAQSKDDEERDKEEEGVDDYINPFLQSPIEEEKEEEEKDTINTAAAAVYNNDNNLESASHIQQHFTNTTTIGSSSAEVKSKKAAMVTKDKYEIEELGDAGWKGILGQLDTLLHSQGLPTLSADERPVAIRSLVVSTAREDVAVALQRAAADVSMYRKTKQFINNGEG